MRFITFLLIFFLFSFFSHAQERKTIDSLYSIYNTPAHDTVRVLVLADIAEKYHRSAPDTAITLAEKAAAWSERIAYEKGKARAYNVIGLGYWIKSNYAEALANYQKSISFFERSNDLTGYALCLNNIGLIYYYQNDHPLSLEYFRKALKINKEIDSQEGIALVVNNIGLNYEALGDLKPALEYYQRALKIYEKAGIKMGIGQSLTNIGYVHFNQENHTEALLYLQKAAALQEQINDKSTLVSTLLCMAEIYQRQKLYDQSVAYAERALQLALEVKSTFDVKEATHVLYKTYKARHDFARSLEYFEQYKALNDSIFSIENNKAIASLEARVTLERKQKEIEVLEKDKALQRLMNYLVIAGLLIVSILIFFILRNRKKLQLAYNRLEDTNSKLLEVKKEVEIKAEMLRKSNQTKDKIFSIVSHDLRSPLAALKSLFTLLEAKSLASDELKIFVPELGKRIVYATDIVEELLHWSQSQMDVIESNPVAIGLKELLEKKVLRFTQAALDKGVNLVLTSVPEDYSVCADLNMVKTVLRNLITNAIKFCRRGDTITVTAMAEGDRIRICVADTGIGIKPEDCSRIFREQGFTTYGTAHEKGTGLGLTLCKEFVEKNGGKIWMESEWGKGTMFCFTLPIARPQDT
jgi:two-component system sensor histidine kinase/response regulator